MYNEDKGILLYNLWGSNVCVYECVCVTLCLMIKMHHKLWGFWF